LRALLPDALAASPELRRIDELETSPIVSTHLAFDRPVLGDDFTGLLGTTTQWAFDRSRLSGGAAENGVHWVSTVISAARAVADWDTTDVVSTTVSDLRALLPPARAARLQTAVVVKERHATIATTCASEGIRPGPATPVKNLFLAGDWTATGLPPTIESAVASGERAARLLAVGLDAARMAA
jgi:uncharacterized protein with NAD-binding domain and iron-sulfur cluster